MILAQRQRPTTASQSSGIFNQEHVNPEDQYADESITDHIIRGNSYPFDEEDSEDSEDEPEQDYRQLINFSKVHIPGSHVPILSQPPARDNADHQSAQQRLLTDSPLANSTLKALS